ncbi:hypothetical protein ACERZ8_12565 [Tateyamaria armeniaca]|uniref:SnoaL-like domain-containing protein n=1 Tax=Tateyamaria armeniaca TaxID=2518930 RepID=A0ABW8UZV8_9RHOB
MDNLARNFIENRLDAVTEHFVFPNPFYAHDTLQVFGAPCTMKEALTLYRDATVRAGITNIVPRVLAEGVPVNGYSNVWIEWDHFDQSGTCLRTSQVHYVLYRDDSALFPKIELVEYKAMAFPEVSASFAMAKIA